MENQQYFEGILQLRNPSRELIDFVRDRIIKDKKGYIAKEKKVKNGIDLYLSSQHYMQNLGRQIQQKFNGELKISAKLHTRKRITSKNVYRVNVMFRLFPYSKNQVININGEEVKIMVLAKKVLVKNIKTGKKEHYGYGEFEKLARP